MTVAYAVVSSGSQISDAVGLRNVDRAMLWCPVVTSCDLRFLGSFDQTSANFVPVTDPASAPNRVVHGLSTGSLAIHVGADIASFPYLKLDLSVAQTDTRSFAIVGS